MANIIDPIPKLFVNLTTSVSNVTGSGGSYTVRFDTIQKNVLMNYSISTGNVTITIAGNYFIATNLSFNNIINGANNNITSIGANGTFYRLSEASANALKTPTNTQVTNGGLILNLPVGATVGIFAIYNNGSAASVGVVGSTAPSFLSYLYMRYLP